MKARNSTPPRGAFLYVVENFQKSLNFCLDIYYIMPRHKREVINMSPRTGRPIMGEERKDKQIALRVTETTKRKFQECSIITGKTQTNLLEEMVDELHDKLTKKE